MGTIVAPILRRAERASENVALRRVHDQDGANVLRQDVLLADTAWIAGFQIEGQQGDTLPVAAARGERWSMPQSGAQLLPIVPRGLLPLHSLHPRPHARRAFSCE